MTLEGAHRQLRKWLDIWRDSMVADQSNDLSDLLDGLKQAIEARGLDAPDPDVVATAIAIRRGGPEFTAWMRSCTPEECYALGRVFGSILKMKVPS